MSRGPRKVSEDYDRIVLFQADVMSITPLPLPSASSIPANDAHTTQALGLGVVTSLPSARTVALRFLRWAHDNALLLPDAYVPAEGHPHPALQPSPTATAVSLLRQKQICLVGVNESAREVVVFLQRATPGEKALKALPKMADGIEVKYRQGQPEAINPAHVAEASSIAAMHVTTVGNHYTCGSSISVGNARSAGTMGCLVSRQGVLMGLSVNHVSGSCNFAPLGLPILAPGVIDVTPQNPSPFTIGFHSANLPLIAGDPSLVSAAENFDAAIFKVKDASGVSSMQKSFYDTPSTSVPLQAGMLVEKVGRSTGHTKGKVIVEIVGPTGIPYSAPSYDFAGKVHFDPLFVVHGLGDRFSAAGDSGSLVVHQDAAGVRHAVGIVVGGSVDSKAPGQKTTLVLPLQPILERLGVTLVAGHNV